jgi:membrane protein YdbS with pleckstrin-like domain
MKYKKTVLILIWVLVLAACLGLVGFYFTDPTKEMWIMAVAGLAIFAEVAFWSTAAIMGVSLWESRQKVYRFLFRRAE